MKKFNGFDEAKKNAQYKGFEKLPAGAYVCKVQNVKEESMDWGDRLVIAFDICEGDYSEFFKKKYDSDTSEDKKWKGVARINQPKDDGSEKDGWTKNTFARWINSFEESNDGYSWDWDERKLNGKLVGIVFGETGNVIGGKEVVYTEVRAACSVEDVHNNNYWDGYLKFKSKNGYTGNQQISAPAPVTDSEGFMDIPAGIDEEIPF